MAEKAAKKVKNPRIAMPEQDPQVRARNFLEVPTGYTNKMAQEEAARCLQCKKPGCVDGCPVSVDIPGFINLISEGDFTGAIRHVWTKNALRLNRSRRPRSSGATTSPTTGSNCRTRPRAASPASAAGSDVVP